MSLIVFEHCDTEDACMLGVALGRHGHRLRSVRLFAGDPVPPDLDDVDGVVSMGGPMNVDQVDQYPWLDHEMRYLRATHDAGVPVIGICLGAQLIAAALDGQVSAMAQPEVGWQTVKLAFPGTVDPVHAGIGWQTTQFHLHGQEVTRLPTGAVPLSGSQACKHQAFRVGLTTYAFQYHFEWDHQTLKQMAADPLVAKAGHKPDQIIHQIQDYYDDYRRLGDRLSDTLATVLFPIDKR